MTVLFDFAKSCLRVQLNSRNTSFKTFKVLNKEILKYSVNISFFQLRLVNLPYKSIKIPHKTLSQKSECSEIATTNLKLSTIPLERKKLKSGPWTDVGVIKFSSLTVQRFSSSLGFVHLMSLKFIFSLNYQRSNLVLCRNREKGCVEQRVS